MSESKQKRINRFIEETNRISAYEAVKSFWDAFPETCDEDKHDIAPKTIACVTRAVPVTDYSGKPVIGKDGKPVVRWDNHAVPIRRLKQCFLTYTDNRTYISNLYYKNKQLKHDDEGNVISASFRYKENGYGTAFLSLDFDLEGHDKEAGAEKILEIAQKLLERLPEGLREYVCFNASGGGLHVFVIFTHILPGYYAKYYNDAVKNLADIIYPELCAVSGDLKFKPADKIVYNHLIRKAASYNTKYGNGEFVDIPVLYAANADGQIHCADPKAFVDYWCNGKLKGDKAREQLFPKLKNNHYTTTSAEKKRPLFYWTDESLRKFQRLSQGRITEEMVEGFIAKVPDNGTRKPMSFQRAYAALKSWSLTKEEAEETRPAPEKEADCYLCDLILDAIAGAIHDGSYTKGRHMALYSVGLYSNQYGRDCRSTVYYFNGLFSEPLPEADVEHEIQQANVKFRQYPDPFPEWAIEDYLGISIPTFSSNEIKGVQGVQNRDPEKVKEYNDRRGYLAKLATASKGIKLTRKVQKLYAAGYTYPQIFAQTGVSESTVERYIRCDIAKACVKRGYSLEEVELYDSLIASLNADTASRNDVLENADKNSMKEDYEILTADADEVRYVSTDLSTTPLLVKAMKDKRNKDNNCWLPTVEDFAKYQKEIDDEKIADIRAKMDADREVSVSENPWGLFEYDSEKDIPLDKVLDDILPETAEDITLNRRPEIRDLSNGKWIAIPYNYLHNLADEITYSEDILERDVLPAAIDYKPDGTFDVYVADHPAEPLAKTRPESSEEKPNGKYTQEDIDSWLTPDGFAFDVSKEPDDWFGF